MAELRAALLAAVDRVALPRRWRFVDALPVNAQGKSTEALLGALFAPPVEARPLRPTPKWRIAEPTHAQASLALAPDLLVFDGHFPGSPDPARRRAGGLGHRVRARALRACPRASCAWTP